METKDKQAEATERNHRQNVLAKSGDLVAIIFSLLAFLGFFMKLEGWVCAAIVIALVSGAFSLYIAASQCRIRRAAVTLIVLSVLVNLLLPFAARRWSWLPETSLGLNLLLNFSLLCLTGAVVALLRNNFGNLEYIEEHDNRSALVLAIFLVVSTCLRVFGKSYEPAAGLADLCLVIAGVVIGAMFEKERSNRRHAKKAATGKV